MTTPITISIPHQLGRAEARRRIDSGFASMFGSLPGGVASHASQWDGDRLSFRLTGMGQTISGVIDVLDETVTMQIELPGLLGRIAGVFRERVRKAGQLLLTRK